ncbi:MAG TPA: multidrug ABC transporter permease [Erythrobacter sp.]|jgi:ABC-2 type transport system permease protein|uniref:ABC transporter permease n=1 Tax=Qipengyuania TaxID=1855416 RepID=UPI0009EE3469|nr:ABC transporter permease [Qipengyuania citrea]MAC30404.1 multidrug ABC transporter permease [Erythrobacter sp.]MAL54902.1 multidrug ABC transporter permease [Sphingomonadaceae bacterium]MBN90867.1 multidrug ABC transporter permease [Erythrobacteraceae bacterium]MCZ4265021.1 ABC transporter permease [Erythrobacter sp. G21629-S1]MAQ29549.1 multidrug ABC transporter permease [Erythrobacter sp.]|tara:strand:+ start:374 stop:1273 length:900 start_codon:yes stop_codon:yes gene_type:complete
MVDQAQPKSLGSDHPDASFVEGNAGGESRFPPRGRPVIRGINRIGLWSLYMKEVRRFLKVQTQTIWAPAVTTVLFLVIFSVALGRGGREVLGVNFPTFVAPGLIAMAMMQNAFANSSFSLLSGKIQGTIIDLLMPPLSEGELMCGIVGAAMTRAVAVGFVVAGAMMLYPGVSLAMAHPWAVVWFGLMGAMMLALLGLLASIWAEKFDHNAAVTNFVVAPLAMLSGTFYVIDRLAPAFQAVSRANPFFYVISGFRYGFLGRSDIGDAAAVTMAALGLFALNAVLAFATYRILKSGWKIKN